MISFLNYLFKQERKENVRFGRFHTTILGAIAPAPVTWLVQLHPVAAGIIYQKFVGQRWDYSIVVYGKGVSVILFVLFCVSQYVVLTGYEHEKRELRLCSRAQISESTNPLKIQCLRVHEGFEPAILLIEIA